MNEQEEFDALKKRVEDLEDILEPDSWWKHHWFKVCLIALFVWTTLGFYYTNIERNDRIDAVQGFSVELRNGLIASCEKNGNPLREAVQGLLEEEIKQSNPKVLQQFFPQIPPDVLERIVEKTTTHKQEVIEEIEPLNCSALYPPVEPGETTDIAGKQTAP